MGELVRLCGRQDIEPGTARCFDVGGLKIALVRIDGEYYAISDTCSHEDYSLSEGEVLSDEREIECWKHGSMFDLVSGEPRSLPATQPVATYELRIEGDDVLMELP